jgi:hypothetical protein
MADFLSVRVEGGKKFAEHANASIRKIWSHHIHVITWDFYRALMKVAPQGKTGNYRKGTKAKFKKGETPLWGKVQSYPPAYHSHFVEFGTKDRFTRSGAYRGRMKPTLAGSSSSNIGLQGPYRYTMISRRSLKSMGIKDIGQAIKSTVQDVALFNGRVFAPDELPPVINAVPAALVMLGEQSYSDDFSGNRSSNFRVVALVSDIVRPTGLDRLFELIEAEGANSLAETLSADPTFDGACDTSILRRNTGQGTFTWGEQTFLSTEFEIEVYW